MTKVDKSNRNLSLQTQTRLSELAIEKKDHFNFNNEKLQEFLKKALIHIEQKTNRNDAEHVAHFLMGIKTDLPKGLDRGDLSLNDEQKKYLHSAIRTNRYGIFGKEKNEKTIEKLKALNEKVNFEIKWQKKISRSNEGGKTEEKTVSKTNNGSTQPSSYPGRVSESLETHGGNVVHEKAKPIAENQKKSENLTDVLEKLYKTASKKYSVDEEKWGKLKEKINLYFETMEAENSKNFTEILSNSRYSFDQLVDSFTMYTALSEDTAKRMATERELVNIEMKGKPASQNEKVLGNKKSLAQRDPNVVQPGNQLSLATKTKIRCDNGELREITLLSESGPALDVASQPEVDIYTYKSPSGGRKLHRQKFAIALETLKSHTLACATSNKDCGRVVLAAIGAGNFLKILDEKHRQYAQDMIARMLAEVVVELRKQGKDVGFTDINQVFCDKINAKIEDEKLYIKVLGSIPGNWIQDGDLMLNAWDPSSLLGNGLAADNSLDGFYGRNSLIHFQHALL
jgi:hypothetical protein